jgi:cytochrome c oxidase cbb3-type subunit I/II
MHDYSKTETLPAGSGTLRTVSVTYQDKPVRYFIWASIIFGLVAMLAGVLAALQLSHWQANMGLEFITFGRLRPLHTNAAIFAFVGNMMFAGIYYSTQRLCKVATASNLLTWIHFWGWQLIILFAAISLPLGYTRGKEYAELIWPINIMVAVIWVVFAINFFWTLAKRNEPSLYVALWFYIATIVTVAMLYIVNHLSVPTSWNHSYSLFAGVQDALVQWWYGHNAVAFFLTTPILGIMYYFMPKAAQRPVYSYRLSIVHFWSLVFIYIWAGPHHLLNTALPEWLQYLGMFFSLMLWAPSWGGMLNGLLTLRGAWDKLRTDPVIKFFVAGITFYGMSTFEGPLLSIRAVNYLSHYTDWTIGHVHGGTLGWNGFMAAGMFYWLAPRLWGRPLHSKALANMHFWIGLVGILIYMLSMWVAGIMQGLMLNSVGPDGTPVHKEFVDTTTAIMPMYWARFFGGVLYLAGFLILTYNIARTAIGSTPVVETKEFVVPEKLIKDDMGWAATFKNDPMTYLCLGLVFLLLSFFLPTGANFAAMVCTGLLAIMAVGAFKRSNGGWAQWYERLEANWLPFTVLTLIAVAIGGAVQIIPAVVAHGAASVEDRKQVLYTPLELAGRDIYITEGCYNCHSQMIRTIRPDVARYGDWSRLGESIYDHPFQWGSRRTGPDLAREGGKRTDSWHYNHFMDPRWANKGSIMPSYAWLAEQKLDVKALPGKIAVQRTYLKVPYPAMDKHEIEQSANDQAMKIAMAMAPEMTRIPEGGLFKDLQGKQSVAPEEMANRFAQSKMVALIAYMQKLGTYEKVEAKPAAEPKPGLPDRGFGVPDRQRSESAAR